MMKNYILLFVFFIMAGAVLGQDDVYYQPPKNNYKTKILIQTDKPKADNVKYCMDVLTKNDIVFRVDNTTKMIKTDVLNTQKREYPFYLNFICKDSVIVLSGKFKSGISLDFGTVISEDNFETITSRGAKGSIARITFDEMVAVSQLFGSKITLK